MASGITSRKLGPRLLEEPLSSSLPAPSGEKAAKGARPLELFVPHEEGYEFKVIVTNKRGNAKTILLFHNGRGSQESIFSELKSRVQHGYVPTRRLAGNQLYYLSAVLAHNLYRELQIDLQSRCADNDSETCSFVAI